MGWTAESGVPIGVPGTDGAVVYVDSAGAGVSVGWSAVGALCAVSTERLEHRLGGLHRPSRRRALGAPLWRSSPPRMTPGELFVIICMAVAVYVPKALPLVVVSEGLTTRLRPWLQYVAPAVLGALVVPSIIAPGGHPAVPGLTELGYLVAFLVAIA